MIGDVALFIPVSAPSFPLLLSVNLDFLGRVAREDASRGLDRWLRGFLHNDRSFLDLITVIVEKRVQHDQVQFPGRIERELVAILFAETALR